MKRIIVLLCMAVALAACGDGYNQGSDGGINAPPDRIDTTDLYDTTTVDTTNLRPDMK